MKEFGSREGVRVPPLRIRQWIMSVKLVVRNILLTWTIRNFEDTVPFYVIEWQRFSWLFNACDEVYTLVPLKYSSQYTAGFIPNYNTNGKQLNLYVYSCNTTSNWN